jgi:hypothetical protein
MSIQVDCLDLGSRKPGEDSEQAAIQQQRQHRPLRGGHQDGLMRERRKGNRRRAIEIVALMERAQRAGSRVASSKSALLAPAERASASVAAT